MGRGYDKCDAFKQSGFSLTAALTSSNLEENTPVSFTLYLISGDFDVRVSHSSFFGEKNEQW